MPRCLLISECFLLCLAISSHGLQSRPTSISHDARLQNFANQKLIHGISSNNTLRPTTSTRSTITSTGTATILSQANDDDHEPLTVHTKQSSRQLVGKTGLAAFGTVVLTAKAGILPGLAQADGIGFSPYTNELILRDSGAAVLCAVLGYVFVKVITVLAKNDKLQPRDSRKIIHTLSAPLFMLFWPCFSMAEGARFFAGVVALINAVRLFIAGTGSSDDDESDLANAVSRSGNVQEALGGPFIYVIILLASILIFWRDSLLGIVPLCAMAAGDGMADILGRRFGANNKWFFSPDKSVAGSLAFFSFSTLFSTAIAFWLTYTGCLTTPFETSELILRIAGISAVCAAIELQPLGDDNWTVPLSAALLSALFLR